ncbi:hypothetical protein Dda_4233 [Drechslerella dactyloides]|uniref:Uncharacterized protein n=1 Tax=Drechslerella dactyloides TaxID=74499 RepID=A0AAD6NLV0_DREDA|nr:hypothetical protein Dda_4233 [Drechslerella dactyloides]
MHPPDCRQAEGKAGKARENPNVPGWIARKDPDAAVQAGWDGQENRWLDGESASMRDASPRRDKAGGRSPLQE